MQIKQSSANLALVFFMVDSTDHVTGKTGLTPTVTLSKNGGAFASPAGAVSEIAGGFYKVAPHATDSNTLGILALTATATGADRAAMAFEIVANLESDSITAIAALNNLSAAQVRAVLPEIGNLDAAVSSRNATAPDNAGIAGIKAVTDAATQLLLAAPYVPAESPVLVIPAPDGDESLTVVYIHTESITNVKRAGIEITLKLITTPAKSERVLEIAPKTMTTDAEGYAQITLQRGFRYRATSRDLAINHIVETTGETLDLLTVIP